MKYDYDYEFAFYANRTEYLTTGHKNPCKYRLTGCFNTGDYWVEDANNRKEIAAKMAMINGNATIIQNTIAMQNEFGQLMWTRETGWNAGIIHPAYMGKMKCFEVKAW